MQPVFGGHTGDSAAQPGHLLPDLLNVLADVTAYLHLRLHKFRFQVQSPRALLILGDQFTDIGMQVAADRVDDLVFLFYAKGQGWFRNRHEYLQEVGSGGSTRVAA